MLNKKNITPRFVQVFDVQRYSFEWFIVIASFVIAIRAASLFSTEFAFGIDGYYYAAQIKSFWLKGRFFSPDSSIILPAMAYFSKLGGDTVFMNKLFVLFLNLFLLFGAYLTGSRVSKFSGLLLATYFGVSSLAIQFSFEFVKNFGGLVFYIYFLAFLIKPEKTKVDYLLIALFFISGSLSHKLIAGISLLSAFLFFLHMLYSAHKERVLLFLKKQYLWILTATVIFVVGFSTAYLYLPNFLHLTDLERVAKAFSFFPQLAAASYLKIRMYDTVSLVETGLILSVLLFSIVKGIRQFRLKAKVTSGFTVLLSLALLSVAWFPFLQFTQFDLAYRLFLLSFIPVGLLGICFIDIQPRLQPLVLVSLLALGVWNNHKVATEKRWGIDYGTISQVTPLIKLPEDSLMIVHQGFDYYYCYAERKDAYHFLAEKKHEGRPIFRLAFGVPSDLYEQYLGEQVQQIQFLPGFYSLLPEKLWSAFIEKLPKSERSKHETWRNPYTSREGFLRRNDKFKKE